MTKGTILLCLASLTLGVFVGLLLSAGAQSGGRGGEGQAPSTRPPTRQDVLVERGASGRIRSESSKASGRLVLTDRDHGAGGVAVAADLLTDLGLPGSVTSFKHELIVKGGKIEEYLGLNEEEEKDLQAAWAQARDEIRAAETASATWEELEDGAVRIVRPLLPVDLQRIERGFSGQVIALLGPERGEVFTALKGTAKAFAPAAAETVYTVVSEATGDGGWRFRMTQEVDGQRRVWVGGKIPEELRHLADAAGIVETLEATEESQ